MSLTYQRLNNRARDLGPDLVSAWLNLHDMHTLDSCASLLNAEFKSNYDKNMLCRWRAGRAATPRHVQAFMRKEILEYLRLPDLYYVLEPPR